MARQCDKCSKDLNDDEIHINCCGCGNVYHPYCTTIKAATWRAKGKKDKEAWRCHLCRDSQKNNNDAGSDTVSLDGESDEIDMRRVLLEIRNDLRRLNAKYDDTSEVMSRQGELIKALHDELKMVKKELTVKNHEISSLKQEIVEMQQYSRNKNIEIHNVPEAENEDLKEVVPKIAQLLGIHLEKRDVDVAHRLPSRNQLKPKPIIVQFSSRTVRDQVIAKKKMKIQVRDFDKNQRESRDTIIIYENLAPYYKSLLHHTRQWAETNNFKYVWFKNGAVLVKKSELHKKVHKVKRVEDLEKILQNKQPISDRGDDAENDN